MPKKQAKGAFYFFMRQEYEIFRENGITFKNGFRDPELCRMASEKWKLLSVNERKFYEEMAKTAKEDERGEVNMGRLDCLGNLISERENLEEEPLKRRKQQSANLREQFKRMGVSLVAQEKFYLIQFEILCETDEGEILPCEIGLVEYSLTNGISKEYHSFIDPGPIPIGYSYTCMANSETTHKIPIKDFDLASDDYCGIHSAILNIVDPERSTRCPVVYATINNIPVIEKCLAWLAQNVGDFHISWEIYEAEVLFQELHMFVDKPLPRGIVFSKLSSAVYDYEPNTRCAWHEEKEVKDCALGHVKRICFQISEHTCSLYNCVLTTSHLPERCEVPQVPLLDSSNLSFNFKAIKNKTPQEAPAPLLGNKPSRYNMLKKTGFSKIGDDFNSFENDAVAEVEGKTILKPLRMPSTKGITESLGSKYERGVAMEPLKTDGFWPRPTFTSDFSGIQGPRFQSMSGIRPLMSQPTPGIRPLSRGSHLAPNSLPDPTCVRFSAMAMTRLGTPVNPATQLSKTTSYGINLGRGTTIEKTIDTNYSLNLGRGHGLLSNRNMPPLDKLSLQDD